MSKQECACPDCKCMVEEKGLHVDGKPYCSDACANGHVDGKGCGHGCGCAG